MGGQRKGWLKDRRELKFLNQRKKLLNFVILKIFRSLFSSRGISSPSPVFPPSVYDAHSAEEASYFLFQPYSRRRVMLYAEVMFASHVFLIYLLHTAYA